METIGGLYDLAFSIGAACSCSSSLRRAGLQYASFPFDWVGWPSLRERSEMVCRDFAGWMEPEDMERRPSPSWHAMGVFVNRKTRMVFNHDFPREGEIVDLLPPVRAKYARRIERLFAQIRASRRVLVVYLETPIDQATPDGDLFAARENLERKFPGVSFDLLYFRYREGVPVRKAEVRDLSEHVRVVAFDYKDRKDPHYDFAVRIHEIVPFLKAFRVTDYRTAAEKRAYAAKRKRESYERFKATSWVDYVWTRLHYKLYRHFRKKLVRKGVQLEA